MVVCYVCSIIFVMNSNRTYGEGCVHENRIKHPHPQPSNLLLTVPRQCFCCGLFFLSAFIRVLFVFEFLFFLFRIAWWPFAGKELSSSFYACIVLFYAILHVIVYVPFPFGVWGRIWTSCMLCV